MSVVALILILLSLVNLKNNTHSSNKVLGAEIYVDTDILFWSNFLKNNPTYIPGWVELNNFEVVKQIDPNYIY